MQKRAFKTRRIMAIKMNNITSTFPGIQPPTEQNSNIEKYILMATSEENE